jgi:hypothetical protein
MTTTTRTLKEEMNYQILRNNVNDAAHKEGRITTAQFLATRSKIRERLEQLRSVLS